MSPNKELSVTVKLSGNLKKKLEQFKKIAEEKIRKLKLKENRSFLKYMILYHVLDNFYKPKKNISDQYLRIHQECEGKTYEELKSIWKGITGREWEEVE